MYCYDCMADSCHEGDLFNYMSEFFSDEMRQEFEEED